MWPLHVAWWPEHQWGGLRLVRLRGWWLSTLKARGPVDEAEVALPFLSQSQKSERGPDQTSVPCTLRFKGRGHDPPLEGRVARSHYRGVRVRGAITETAAEAYKGITIIPLASHYFPLRLAVFTPVRLKYFAVSRVHTLLQPTFPQVFPFLYNGCLPCSNPLLDSPHPGGEMFMVCWVPFSGALRLSVYLRNGLHIVWFITAPSRSLICQLLQRRGSFLTPNI